MRNLLRTVRRKSLHAAIVLPGMVVVLVTLIGEVGACVITPIATARRVVHRLGWLLGA